MGVVNSCQEEEDVGHPPDIRRLVARHTGRGGHWVHGPGLGPTVRPTGVNKETSSHCSQYLYRRTAAALDQPRNYEAATDLTPGILSLRPSEEIVDSVHRFDIRDTQTPDTRFQTLH
ncbi:hypothetical protein J6590_068433 [Homalodisca vitripennis]|nr:hypothetical protein J6590_068433 [Homalodisca vitripennis]